MDSNRFYVTLVARLQVDGQGNILRGELASADGLVRRRFQAWCGLKSSIKSYLTEATSPDTRASQ